MTTQLRLRLSTRRPDPRPGILAQAAALGWEPDQRHRQGRWCLPGTPWCLRVGQEYTSIYALVHITIWGETLHTCADLTRYPTYQVSKILGHLALLAQEVHR